MERHDLLHTVVNRHGRAVQLWSEGGKIASIAAHGQMSVWMPKDARIDVRDAGGAALAPTIVLDTDTPDPLVLEPSGGSGPVPRDPSLERVRMAGQGASQPVGGSGRAVLHRIRNATPRAVVVEGGDHVSFDGNADASDTGRIEPLRDLTITQEGSADQSVRVIDAETGMVVLDAITLRPDAPVDLTVANWHFRSEARKVHVSTSIVNTSGRYVDLFRIDETGVAEPILARFHPGEERGINGFAGQIVQAVDPFDGATLGLFVTSDRREQTITIDDAFLELQRRILTPPRARFNGQPVQQVPTARSRVEDRASGDYSERFTQRSVTTYRPLKDFPGDADLFPFNTRDDRLLRDIEISGVDLVLDHRTVGADGAGAQERCSLAGFEKPTDDLRTLTLYADRVIIARPMLLPRTKLTIYARELVFKGEGKIDTTPIAYPQPAVSQKEDHPDGGVYPKGMKAADGGDGETGGDIILNVSRIDMPEDDRIRLRTTGSRGQDPEPGGLKPYTQRSRTIAGRDYKTPNDAGASAAPLTEDQLYQAFKTIAYSKKPYGCTWPGQSGGKDWIGEAGKTKLRDKLTAGEIVCAAIGLISSPSAGGPFSYVQRPVYGDVVTVGQTLDDEGKQKLKSGGHQHKRSDRPREILNWDDMVCDWVNTRHDPNWVVPGDGRDAYRAGIPGRGGDGGRVRLPGTAHRPEGFAKRMDMARGAPGTDGKAVSGGAAGGPTPAYCLHITGVDARYADWRVSDRNFVLTDVSAKKGADAQATTNSEGADGNLELVQADPLDWLHGNALDAVLLYARNALRVGQRDAARDALEPYVAALAPKVPPRSAAARGKAPDSSHVPDRLAVAWVTLNALRDHVNANVDQYGNPPGWVPRLRVFTQFQNRLSTQRAAVALILAARRMQERYDGLMAAEKDSARAEDAIRHSMDELQDQLQAAADALPEAQRSLAAINDRIAEIRGRIFHTRQAVLNDASAKAADQRMWTAAWTFAGAALKIIPYGQPVTGGVGDIFGVVSKFDVTGTGNAGAEAGDAIADIGGLLTEFREKNKSFLEGEKDPGGHVKKLKAELKEYNDTVQQKRAALRDEIVGLEDGVAVFREDRLADLQHRVTQVDRFIRKKLEAALLAEKDDGKDPDEDRKKSAEAKAAAVEAKLKEVSKSRLPSRRAFGPNAGKTAGEVLERDLAQIEALKEGRREVLREQVGLSGLPEDVQENILDEIEEEDAVDDVVKEFKAFDKAHAKDARALKARIDEAEAADTERHRKRKALVANFKRLGEGVADIGKAIRDVSAPLDADSPDVKALVATMLEDENSPYHAELLQYSRDLAALLEEKKQAGIELRNLLDRIGRANGEIVSLVNEVSAVSDERQRLSGVLDVSTRVYLGNMEARARDWLEYALYSFEKSFLFEFLEDVSSDIAAASDFFENDRFIEKLGALGEEDGQDGIDSVAQLNLEDQCNTLLLSLMKKRNSEGGAVGNAYDSIVLSERHRAELARVGRTRINFITDYRIGSFEAFDFRVTDVTITNLVVGTRRPNLALEIVVAHSGESVIRAPSKVYYGFSKGPNEDPIKWSFTWNGGAKATDGVSRGEVVKDKPQGEVDQMLEAIPGMSKYKPLEYQPSLFSDFTVSILDFDQRKDDVSSIEDLVIELGFRRKV